MAYPLVIDLSHHNSVSDFAAIAQAGVLGVIHKATEGKSYSDETYWQREADARAAGLQWASYHFLKHGDIDLQMENYLQVANPEKRARVCIDFEDSALTIDDLLESVWTLAQMRPDLEIAVYGSSVLKETIGNQSYPELSATSLWIAHYTDRAQPVWPSQVWPVWSLWQYTSTGQIAGVDGQVDINRFNGSEENCLKWFHPDAEPAPAPAPTPSQKCVKIEINTPEGVEIEVKVNGKILE